MAKAVVNGKMYNTDTARVIGWNSNMADSRNFYWMEETLCCTQNGQYFLVGSGGAMSKYSRSAGQNSWTGSNNNFTPITKKDALIWCEENDISANVIEKEFADLLKDA